MKLVITGGGTGGHIFAGIAIAQEFKSQSVANEVLFVGSESGLENRLVPRWGFKLETLKLGKLVGQTFLNRLVTLAQIPWAVFRSMRILKKFKADMVVGVGGYAAGPCIVAARLLGIPSGVLEQNSIMGFTNRIAASFANQVFLAFEGTAGGTLAKKCIATGNPTRSNLTPQALKPLKPFLIFAFGGSQGATGINKLMTEAARILIRSSNKEGWRIVHQTGERDFEWVKKAYADMGVEAETHKFIDDMQSVYNRASLVVCRSGSGTISELGATKNAAVFVPFPLAAGNHQELNARAVERTGAARVLIQSQATGEDLARLFQHFIEAPQELTSMREKMAGFYRPNAASRIIEVMKVRGLGLGK